MRVYILLIGTCLSSCAWQYSASDAAAMLRGRAYDVASTLAVFRASEGCYPHAKAGLRFVVSNVWAPTAKAPDGSFTATITCSKASAPPEVDCYYLNPEAGTLSDPASKIILVVLRERKYGLVAVIDSSCAQYGLRYRAIGSPATLLGKSVAELGSYGDVELLHKGLKVEIVDDGAPLPTAPWRGTCNRPEHLPWE